jgi:hypothetical protein
MRAYLHHHRGRTSIVFTDSKGAGLPVLDTRRAWRDVVYRQPKPCKRRAA